MVLPHYLLAIQRTILHQEVDILWSENTIIWVFQQNSHSINHKFKGD